PHRRKIQVDNRRRRSGGSRFHPVSKPFPDQPYPSSRRYPRNPPTVAAFPSQAGFRATQQGSALVRRGRGSNRNELSRRCPLPPETRRKGTFMPAKPRGRQKTAAARRSRRRALTLVTALAVPGLGVIAATCWLLASAETRTPSTARIALARTMVPARTAQTGT